MLHYVQEPVTTFTLQLRAGQVQDIGFVTGSCWLSKLMWTRVAQNSDVTDHERKAKSRITQKCHTELRGAAGLSSSLGQPLWNDTWWSDPLYMKQYWLLWPSALRTATTLTKPTPEIWSFSKWSFLVNNNKCSSSWSSHKLSALPTYSVLSFAHSAQFIQWRACEVHQWKGLNLWGHMLYPRKHMVQPSCIYDDGLGRRQEQRTPKLELFSRVGPQWNQKQCSHMKPRLQIK